MKKLLLLFLLLPALYMCQEDRHATAIKKFHRANDYYEAGDYNMAMMYYVLATRDDSTFTAAYNGAINAATKLGQYLAVRDMSTRLTRLEPDNMLNYEKRGVAKYMLHDTDGCCQDMYKAKELGDASAAAFIKKYCKPVN